jgi:cyclic pyranopterin phosphate synthase
MAEKKLSHLDDKGRPRMVDVGGKEATARVAVAKGTVRMQPETLKLILSGGTKKGDALTTAKLAGIMAAKHTPDLIPLCHPVLIDSIEVDFEPDEAQSTIEITATARATGRTGVEMEALTATAVAALTVYDMGKAADRGMKIENIRLVHKSGGKSGTIDLE